MFTGIAIHDLQFLPVTKVLVVFYHKSCPSGAQIIKSRGGLSQVSVGDNEHYRFVLSTDLEVFHRGSFWRLSGSVVMRHLVERKMAHFPRVHVSDSCGDRVSCSNTSRGGGTCCRATTPRSLLYTFYTVSSTSNSHECVQLLAVLKAPIHSVSVFVHGKHFQISSTTWKLQISCVARTTTIQPPLSSTVLPFDKFVMALCD